MVIETGEAVTGAVWLAVNVSVEVTVPVPELYVGMAGLALQLAVTPVGNPATLRATGALNEPPVVMVKTSVAVAPCTTAGE